MKLIIDIPENTYKEIKEYFDDGNYGLKTELAIANGTPLPEGHGDLIDRNEIIKRYEKDCGKRIYVDNFIHDIELNIPTIIEADKEE